MDFLSQRQVLIILVGLVGSGKTEFANALSERYPTIIRCNQDELGDRRNVENKVHQTLQTGLSVCIDRTNIDVGQRWTWIDIGRQYPNVEIWCVLMDTPYAVCRERLRVRQYHPTIKDFDTAMKVLNNFSRTYQPPNRSEGFDLVFKLSSTAIKRNPAGLQIAQPSGLPVGLPQTSLVPSDLVPSTNGPTFTSSPGFANTIYTPEDVDSIFQGYISASLSPVRQPPVPLPPKPTPPSRSSSLNSNGTPEPSRGAWSNNRRGAPRGRGGFGAPRFRPNNGNGSGNSHWRPRGTQSRPVDNNWRQPTNPATGETSARSNFG